MVVRDPSACGERWHIAKSQALLTVETDWKGSTQHLNSALRGLDPSSVMQSHRWMNCPRLSHA